MHGSRATHLLRPALTNPFVCACPRANRTQQDVG
jgi:hypothetical protein